MVDGGWWMVDGGSLCLFVSFVVKFFLNADQADEADKADK
jgi:uncharacterized membrane protein